MCKGSKGWDHNNRSPCLTSGTWPASGVTPIIPLLPSLPPSLILEISDTVQACREAVRTMTLHIVFHSFPSFHITRFGILAWVWQTIYYFYFFAKMMRVKDQSVFHLCKQLKWTHLASWEYNRLKWNGQSGKQNSSIGNSYLKVFLSFLGKSDLPNHISILKRNLVPLK